MRKPAAISFFVDVQYRKSELNFTVQADCFKFLISTHPQKFCFHVFVIFLSEYPIMRIMSFFSHCVTLVAMYSYMEEHK